MRNWMAACLVLILAPWMSFAQEKSGAEPQERGSVTNLPIPRFVSLKVDEANVRRGPSLTHRIDWVFKRKGMPVEIIGEYANWRRVRDRDGVGGWVHYSLLSGARTVIVDIDLTPLYQRRDINSPVNAYLEAGVIARAEVCIPHWCLLRAGGEKGWSTREGLWGIKPGELVD